MNSASTTMFAPDATESRVAEIVHDHVTAALELQRLAGLMDHELRHIDTNVTLNGHGCASDIQSLLRHFAVSPTLEKDAREWAMERVDA